MKTTVVSLAEMEDEDFKFPSKYFFINALSQAVFLHCRSRPEAEEYVAQNYGKGFYKIRTSSLEKNICGKKNGELSVRGSNTRKGFSPRLKGLRG